MIVIMEVVVLWLRANVGYNWRQKHEQAFGFVCNKTEPPHWSIIIISETFFFGG